LYLTVARSDQLNQIVLGNTALGSPIYDVVKPGLGCSFVRKALEEELWVCNSPAGKGIHPDKTLICGSSLVACTIPFQKTLIKKMGSVYERPFEMDSWVKDGLPLRFSEPSYYDLLSLIHYE